MLYIIGKVKVCALRICHCFWAWGSFQPVELVLENGLEKWIFWLFSTYMFLESWDQACNESVGIFKIRGHLRPWEVIKGHQRSNLKNNRTYTCYMFLETSRGKYVGFILTLGVTDLLRSLEVIKGHQRSNLKNNRT